MLILDILEKFFIENEKGEMDKEKFYKRFINFYPWVYLQFKWEKVKVV